MPSPTLTFLSQPHTGKTIELTKGRYVLGRKESNDIQIQHSTVSGVHCELIQNADGSYSVVDHGMSTNGTRISGSIVQEHQLQNTDILQVGNVELMYDTNTEPVSSISSFNTHIRVPTNPIIPNEDISLAPKWMRDSDSGLVAWGFKALLGVLGLTLIVLAIIFIHKLLS